MVSGYACMGQAASFAKLVDTTSSVAATDVDVVQEDTDDAEIAALVADSQMDPTQTSGDFDGGGVSEGTPVLCRDVKICDPKCRI